MFRPIFYAREDAYDSVQINILMNSTCRDHVLDVDERFVFGQRAHPSDTCLSVQLDSWTILFVEDEYCRTVCLEAAFFANFSFSFLFRCRHDKATSLYRILKVR